MKGGCVLISWKIVAAWLFLLIPLPCTNNISQYFTIFVVLFVLLLILLPCTSSLPQTPAQSSRECWWWRFWSQMMQKMKGWDRRHIIRDGYVPVNKCMKREKLPSDISSVLASLTSTWGSSTPSTGRLPAEQIHSKFAALTPVPALNMEHSGYFDSPSQTHTRPIFASSTLSEVGLASMKSVWVALHLQGFASACAFIFLCFSVLVFVCENTVLHKGFHVSKLRAQQPVESSCSSQAPALIPDNRGRAANLEHVSTSQTVQYAADPLCKDEILSP